jgi:hypothetical protein
MQRTNRTRWIQIALLATLGLLALSTLTRDAAAYEHRRKTPSIGVQVQYGYMGGSSMWPETVRYGLGVTVSVRRYIARNQALGISFEQQKFARISSLLEDLEDDEYGDLDHIQMQVLMLDYYLYIKRMRRETPYLVFSAGVYRPQQLYEFDDEITGSTGEEVKYPSEGFLARAGAGMEYFLSRNLSIDATVSGYLVNTPDLTGSTFTAQAAIGLQLYAGR